MKNVAATSGQRVSFATVFLVVGNARAGTCAGSDTVLNFFSRPPKANLAGRLPKASSLFEEYSFCAPTQEKNARRRKIFGFEVTVLSYGSFADFHAAWRPVPLFNPFHRQRHAHRRALGVQIIRIEPWTRTRRKSGPGQFQRPPDHASGLPMGPTIPDWVLP